MIPLLIVLSTLLVATPAFARTWYVQADGMGDAPTIQAGVDSSATGDTVLVAAGTYTGPGNRDIDLSGHAVVVVSESGPELTILDCEGLGRGFYVEPSPLPGVRIAGFTVTGGLAAHGGGIYVRSTSTARPTIANCKIVGNEATSLGGGVYCSASDPVFENCEITSNTGFWGGGVYISAASASPDFVGCIVAGNTARAGGGLICGDGVTDLVNCLITGNAAVRVAFDGDGGGIWMGYNAALYMTGCTMSGNHADSRGGGLYIAGIVCFEDCLAWAFVQSSIIDGNCAGDEGDEVYARPFYIAAFSCTILDTTGAVSAFPPTQWGNALVVDPLFCDPEDCSSAPTVAGDYMLDSLSPALGDSCGQIGALGAGCDIATSVAGTSELIPFSMDFSAVPNPSRSEVRMEFSTPFDAQRMIDVYDVTGRLVRRFDLSGSSGSIIWDGTSSAGKLVAPGMYFLRFQVGDRVETRRLMMVR